MTFNSYSYTISKIMPVFYYTNITSYNWFSYYRGSHEPIHTVSVASSSSLHPPMTIILLSPMLSASAADKLLADGIAMLYDFSVVII